MEKINLEQILAKHKIDASKLPPQFVELVTNIISSYNINVEKNQEQMDGEKISDVDFSLSQVLLSASSHRLLIRRSNFTQYEATIAFVDDLLDIISVNIKSFEHFDRMFKCRAHLNVLAKSKLKHQHNFKAIESFFIKRNMKGNFMKLVNQEFKFRDFHDYYLFEELVIADFLYDLITEIIGFVALKQNKADYGNLLNDIVYWSNSLWIYSQNVSKIVNKEDEVEVKQIEQFDKYCNDLIGENAKLKAIIDKLGKTVFKNENIISKTFVEKDITPFHGISRFVSKDNQIKVTINVKNHDDFQRLKKFQLVRRSFAWIDNQVISVQLGKQNWFMKSFGKRRLEKYKSSLVTESEIALFEAELDSAIETITFNTMMYSELNMEGKDTISLYEFSLILLRKLYVKMKKAKWFTRMPLIIRHFYMVSSDKVLALWDREHWDDVDNYSYEKFWKLARKAMPHETHHDRYGFFKAMRKVKMNDKTRKIVFSVFLQNDIIIRNIKGAIRGNQIYENFSGDLPFQESYEKAIKHIDKNVETIKLFDKMNDTLNVYQMLTGDINPNTVSPTFWALNQQRTANEMISRYKDGKRLFHEVALATVGAFLATIVFEILLHIIF